MAVLEAGAAAASRLGARSSPRWRDLPPARSRGHAAQDGRGGEAGARRRQDAQGSPAGRARPLLSRRHRAGVRARRAGTGRPDHARRPRAVAATHRAAAQHQLSRRRGLQARRLDAGPGAAAVAQHPRELRRARDGLQQRELHPHRLPGDEPRLRRPRLLLRRPAFPACNTDQGPALQGVREAARRDDPHGSQRRERGSR